MKTITIKINERSKAGKAVLAMLGFFTDEKNGVEVVVISNLETKKMMQTETKKTIPVSKNIPNALTLKTMKETQEGKNLTKTTSHKDLMDKLFA